MEAKKFGKSKNISILQLNKLESHVLLQSKSEISPQTAGLDARRICH
jgi:hypothetical protein